MNRYIVFFLGLLLGILICVLIFYIDTKKLKSIIISPIKKEVVFSVEKDTVYVETPQPKKIQTTASPKDTSKNENVTDIVPVEDENSIYETEFSYEENESDDIFADRLLHTKTVKVKLFSPEKQEGELPANSFQSFEIQRWSTLIKNKITYYRNQNLIRIKGIQIDNLNVIFYNNTYFLEIENRYYAIPETNNFEKLQSVNLPK